MPDHTLTDKTATAKGNVWPRATALPTVTSPPETATDTAHFERIGQGLTDILEVFCEVAKIAPKRKPTKPRVPVAEFRP